MRFQSAARLRIYPRPLELHGHNLVRMLWKLHFTQNTVQTVLEQPNATLGQLLDEQDILTEAQNNAALLTNFLARKDIAKDLLGYLLRSTPPEDFEVTPAALERWQRFNGPEPTVFYARQYTATEMVQCKLPSFFATVASTPEFLDMIFDVLDHPPPLPIAVSTGFHRLIFGLTHYEWPRVLAYLLPKSGKSFPLVTKMMRHLSSDLFPSTLCFLLLLNKEINLGCGRAMLLGSPNYAGMVSVVADALRIDKANKRRAAKEAGGGGGAAAVAGDGDNGDADRASNRSGSDFVQDDDDVGDADDAMLGGGGLPGYDSTTISEEQVLSVPFSVAAVYAKWLEEEQQLSAQLTTRLMTSKSSDMTRAVTSVIVDAIGRIYPLHPVAMLVVSGPVTMACMSVVVQVNAPPAFPQSCLKDLPMGGGEGAGGATMMGGVETYNDSTGEGGGGAERENLRLRVAAAEVAAHEAALPAMIAFEKVTSLGAERLYCAEVFPPGFLDADADDNGDLERKEEEAEAEAEKVDESLRVYAPFAEVFSKSSRLATAERPTAPVEFEGFKVTPTRSLYGALRIPKHSPPLMVAEEAPIVGKLLTPPTAPEGVKALADIIHNGQRHPVLGGCFSTIHSLVESIVHLLTVFANRTDFQVRALVPRVEELARHVIAQLLPFFPALSACLVFPPHPSESPVLPAGRPLPAAGRARVPLVEMIDTLLGLRMIPSLTPLAPAFAWGSVGTTTVTHTFLSLRCLPSALRLLVQAPHCSLLAVRVRTLVQTLAMAAVKEETEPKPPASDGEDVEGKGDSEEAVAAAAAKAAKVRFAQAVKLLQESGAAASSFLLARQVAGLPWRIPGIVSGHLPIESGYQVVGEEVRKVDGGGDRESDDEDEDEDAATSTDGCPLRDLADMIAFAHEVEAERMERFKASGEASDGEGTRAVDEDDAATAELGEDTDGGDTARLSGSAANVGGEEVEEKGGATGAAVAADGTPHSPSGSPSGSPARPLKLVTPLQPYCPPLGPSYILFGRPLREPTIFAPPPDAPPLPLRPDGTVDIRASVPGAVAVQVSAICTHVFELLMAIAESDQEVHSVLMRIFDSSALPHSIGELSALLRATLGKIPGSTHDQHVPDPRYSAYYISPNVNGGTIVAIPVDKGAMQVVLRDIGMSEEVHIGGVDGFADEGGAAMQVLMGKCSTVTDDDDGELSVRVELPAGGVHDPTLRTNVGASLDGASDSAWACEWGAAASSPPPPPEEDAAAFGEDGGDGMGGGALGAWGGVDVVPNSLTDPTARPGATAFYGGDSDKLFEDDDDDDVEGARAAVGLGASVDGMEQHGTQQHDGGPVLGQGVAAQSSAEMLRVEEDDDA